MTDLLPDSKAKLGRLRAIIGDLRTRSPWNAHGIFLDRRQFIILIFGLLLVSRPAVAENPDIARRFVERGLTGTLQAKGIL
ncbi:hypothetical protein CCR95_04380 [Thiocystis minor]|uniref:hypothetical protein n=1 Tax=Thiocystis minor TaxID=61597 RepID=UPI0019140FDD|nr:hypothetical protein [Thiocystis minor]MBK5963345.1 hypothetical protein [Thiocystis minor]